MASGALPLGVYHRASQVGSGSFGSVLTVYNDAGEEYALKLFAQQTNDNGEDEPIDLGALREISCLRLLRDQNRHENIISLVDIQASSSVLDEGDETGAGTEGCLGMALPLYPAGSLANALTEKRFQGLPRRPKVTLAHGLLSGLAFLHDNGILHRDIKSDNVLLEIDDNGDYKAVLVDFSLAKPIDATIFQQGTPKDKQQTWLKGTFEGVRHTGEIGTITYTAPEIFNAEEPVYGKPMDLWSVGVVLLELWTDALLEAQKNSHALKLVQTKLAEIPDKPFPTLLKHLLQEDPSKRCSVRQALQSDVFAKAGLVEPNRRLIDLSISLPLDYDSENGNNDPLSNQENRPNARKAKPSKRRQLIEKLCNELGGTKNPFTIPAALEYSVQMEQLDDDVENIKESTSLLDCVVLAFRFWEKDVVDLEELENISTGPFAGWNRTDYIDNEASIFLMLDYCLYPRKLR